jgi:hypothetical protein
VPLDRLGDHRRLPGAEQSRRRRAAHLEVELVRDLEPDRLGQPGRFVEARGDVAPARLAGQLGKGDEGAGAAAELVVALAVEGGQAAGSSSSASTKLTGCSG